MGLDLEITEHMCDKCNSGSMIDLKEIEWYNQSFNSAGLSTLAREIRDLKEWLERADRVKKELQKAYDYLTISVVPDVMAAEDVKNINITGVGRLQKAADIRCSVPAKFREDLKEWLCDNGHESMVSDTINSSSLKAWVKEQIKNGEVYPDEFMKIEPYQRATVVAGNG